ncbi:hypothetical protein AO501_01000 [Mycobacterium gordonae]|uniref:Uncharacterized protein n=1 Tax=Mycobacterium gordonae TaxID=1778 RepID=A0A0Q2RLE3_MYCGO|nr:hypothetical protein AO501_01000 [Mycobacterium gordonae]
MALADQALLSAHRARWKRIGLVGAGPTTLAGGLRYLHLADRSRNPGAHLPDGFGDHGLPRVGQRGDPSRRVHVVAEVVIVAAHRGAVVNAGPFSA